MKKGNLKILNRDMVKYLAIGLMFVGHLISWLALLNHPDDPLAPYRLPLWKIVLEEAAVFCPPVMFFFIADGYKYTRDRKKYALRLLIFACITQLFDWFVFLERNGWRSFNVIFTLLLGLLSIMAWESKLKRWQRIALVILCDAATVLIFSEWMIFGVLFILVLHIFRDRPKTRFIVYLSLTLIYNGIYTAALIGNVSALISAVVFLGGMLVMTAAYLCMTGFYNGNKGKHPVFAKWFFYAFYPVHYIIIYAVRICT